MSLTSELISQFVKITNDNQKTKSETTAYGTIVKVDGTTYVKLDGSEILTPVASTANANDKERVTVLIKNHTATVTGNMDSPAARDDDVKDAKDAVDKITEFEILIAYRVTSEDLQATNAIFDRLKSKVANLTQADIANAEIESLRAKYANLETVHVKEVEALNADIENLEAVFGSFADISTEELEAINADITNLKSYNANFTYVSANVLRAMKSEIDQLEVDKLNVNEAELLYANIDFSNIGEAAIEQFFSKSGIIENVVIGEGTVTGKLVGVTIAGDLIEGNTIVAEKLVIKGEDGLYYKLNTDGVTTEAEQTDYNSLNGSIIRAKSVTADKVDVNDLVAFGATIGGFCITDNSLYSGVKESVDNSTRGTYIDSEGQFVVGDSFNYIKFYKLTNENGEVVLDDSGEPIYKLEISADSILFGDGVKSSAADLKALTEHVKIGTIIDENGDEKPCVELAEGDTSFKQVITNTKTMFMDGAKVGTTIDTDGVHTDNSTINKEIRHNNINQTGSYVWAFRSNGNYGLSWKKGVNS